MSEYALKAKESSSLNFTDLDEVVLYHRVNRLLSDYVECIDEDHLEAWPDYFTDDCLYKIIPRENTDRNLPLSAILCDSKGMLVDRIVALREANIYAKHFYRHLISGLHITEIKPSYVLARSNYLVLQTRTDGSTIPFNSGQYLDRITITEDGLKFSEKIAVFDTYRIQTQLVTPV